MIWALTWLAGCPAPHHYPDGSDLAGQLEREVIALMQQKKDLEAELARCTPRGPAAVGPLILELQQVFAGSEVEVLRGRGDSVGLVVRASMLFSDPYALTWRTEAAPTLDLLATALGLHPELEVLVVGHTNDRGLPRSANKLHADLTDLSVHMAQAVTRRFVAAGVPPAQLAVVGRGPWEPEQSNDVESGRDANQRVELWLGPPGMLVGR